MTQRRKPSFFMFVMLTVIVLIAVATLNVASADVGYLLNGSVGGEPDLCNSCMDHVAMTSATEGWAVGEGDYLLHDHGGRWTWVPAPGAFNFLLGVAMSSSSEGWAVGNEILRYHADAWTVARTLPDTMLLYDVALTSPTAGWAVGEQYQMVNSQEYDTGVIWRLANGTWTQFTTIANTNLYSVAVLSPDDVWAVGARSAPGPTVQGGIILHYSDGVWTEAGPPTDVSLTSIALAPDGDGWIAGSDFEEQGLLLRYHGGVWTEAQRLPGVNLCQVTMTSDGDAWAVGHQSDERSLLLHYTEGSWVAVESLVSPGVTSLALTGPGEGWASGVMTHGKTTYGGLLRLRNGTWSPVALPRQPASGGVLDVLAPAIQPYASLPAIVVVLGVLCLLGLALLALALRAPRNSLWHTWGLRLALLGLICYGLVMEASLIAGLIRDGYLFDLQTPVSWASIVSLAAVGVGLLGVLFVIPRMAADPQALLALRARRSPSSGSEVKADQQDDATTPR